MSNRYPDSKLLDAWGARSLAALKPLPTKGHGVVINYLTPGFCHSELNREQTDIVTRTFTRLLARTTEAGSRTLVHAALADEKTHGQFLLDCKVDAPLGIIDTEEGKEWQGRFWTELVSELDGISPGLSKQLKA